MFTAPKHLGWTYVWFANMRCLTLIFKCIILHNRHINGDKSDMFIMWEDMFHIIVDLNIYICKNMSNIYVMHMNSFPIRPRQIMITSLNYIIQ